MNIYRIYFVEGGYTEVRGSLAEVAQKYAEGSIRRIELLS